MAASKALFGLIAFVAVGACAGAAPVVPDFRFIEGGFSRGEGPDGNSYVYEAPGGLIVIDTGRHPAHSALILDYAKACGKPIKAVINTHWHLDHTTGNTDIKAAYPGATVYATNAVKGALSGFLARGAADTEAIFSNSRSLSTAARAELERGLATVRNPDALLPDVVVAGATRVPVDGRDLDLNVAERAVTAADIWIWDPATKTAIVGDLVTVPAPFFDTACPSGWRAALDAIEKKPFERIAAGHGALLGRADYFVWRKAFDNLLACAAEKDGKSCAGGWLADAAIFISDEEKELAHAMIVYYVDRIIRSTEKRAEFC